MIDNKCQSIGLGEADAALESAFSSTARYVWGVGLLASGQASTLTGTLSGQVVMEGFLNMKLPLWKRLVITRSLALGPAVVIATLGAKQAGLPDNVDELLNVLQSLVLPFALVPLVAIAADYQMMKQQFAISKWQVVVYSMLIILVCVVNMYLVVVSVSEEYMYYAIGASVVYAASVVYLLRVSFRPSVELILG